MSIKHLAVVVTALLMIGPVNAIAHDQSEPYAAWFNSLKQNGNGISCCNMHDCLSVQYRIGQNGYQAYVENGWVDIPEDRVLTRENPTGDGVLCRSVVTGKIWCFVAGEQG